MQGLSFEKEETLSFIDFLKRGSGSKRVFTFMLWLIFLWAAQPADDTLLVTAGVLLLLWWLFVRFPSNDTMPQDAPPSA